MPAHDFFNWLAFIPSGAGACLEQLPIVPQPTIANLIWLAVAFLILGDQLR